MYDRILVPTDGSNHAEIAAERGLELAATMDASLFVVSVADTGPLGSIRLPGDEASAAAVLEERAETFVRRIETLAADRGLEDVTTAVREGVPGQEILAYAREIEADAIVMGTSGAGGVERMMLGSVADTVIRSGTIDVLVVGDE